MRILTINVIGIPSGSSSDLINANVFQDYDAVVVNPEDIRSLYGNIRYPLFYNEELNVLTTESGYTVLLTNKDRREQVNDLLKHGGIVVCFMQPIMKYSYNLKYDGEEYWNWITNYDWLLDTNEIKSELGEIKAGTGKTIDYINTDHPFTEYLMTKPFWSAFVKTGDCSSWRVLANAYRTHAVSLSKRVGLGHIILLPSYYDVKNGELLERCIVKLLGDREATPQPSWARDILVPKQEELIFKITEVSDQIDTLERERKTLIDAKDELERWKYLLYEKGKHQLEPVVRDALSLIGCQVEPQLDKASDGRVVCEYGTALLEIVGSKETIKIEKLGELTRNMGNFIAETRGAVKGLLVGNPFCDEPLDNRPPKDTQKQLFAKELIGSAEQQSITVLLTTDLYEIVSRILKGELPQTEKQRLQEQIFKGKGLVRLV